MSADGILRDDGISLPFAACMPHGTFVFVSYAHADGALVYPELERIAGYRVRVWFDEGITPGGEWPAEVARAISLAALVVVMVTPAAMASRNVRNEVNAALSWDKPVLAVHLARTVLPRSMELQMGSLQAILRWQLDDASYARKLSQALAAYAATPPASGIAGSEGSSGDFPGPSSSKPGSALPDARPEFWPDGAGVRAAGTLRCQSTRWVLRRRYAKANQGLDDVADVLAVAVRQQWERAAGERGLTAADPIPVAWGKPSLPLAGPAAVAVSSTRFDPLPGLVPVKEKDLAEGNVTGLMAVYGGLGSGRLVIAGAPGSGKTGAAVLLILDALRHRVLVSAQDRQQVPVPVLLTAQGWDPRCQQVLEWLTRRLRETYPIFAGAGGAASAAALIGAGKVAVLLDGLDEISPDLQPVAVQALSQQTDFRLVILSRTTEMASAAAGRGVLHGAAAIELLPVDAAAAASYLERVQVDPPPDGWRDLLGRLRAVPGGPLARALSSPLTLTLVRDTYLAGDDARSLLDLCDVTERLASGDQVTEVITGHLLDRVLPAAYVRRPGHPPLPYSLQSAQRALAVVAERMNQEGTRDLQWWRIPAWTAGEPRAVMSGLTAAVVVGLIGSLSGGPITGLAAALGGGVAAGAATGLAEISRDHAPLQARRPQLRRALRRDSLLAAIESGLLAGAGAGIATALAAGIPTGAAVGLVSGLAIGSAALADPDSDSIPSPFASWRNDRNYSTLAGLTAGLMSGLAAGLARGLVSGLIAGPAVALVIGLSTSRAWTFALAAARLTARWHTPVRLMRFLEDARERNVLRTAGPAYQFRHARLQDRLATTATRDDHRRTANHLGGPPWPWTAQQVTNDNPTVRHPFRLT